MFIVLYSPLHQTCLWSSSSRLKFFLWNFLEGGSASGKGLVLVFANVIIFSPSRKGIFTGHIILERNLHWVINSKMMVIFFLDINHSSAFWMASVAADQKSRVNLFPFSPLQTEAFGPSAEGE